MRQVAVLLALIGLTSGCSRQTPRAEVVATTGMIADAVQQITQGQVQVVCLMGPGVDPHKYSPSPGDTTALASARLVLYNGLHLEGKMVDILGKSLPGQRRVAVSSGLRPDQLLKSDDAGGEHDPHVWFDVRLWMICVQTISEELCRAFPEHADMFKTNTALYLKELAELDSEVRRKAESLSPEKRVLVTSHDAFRYFGAAYRFEVHGLQGVSTAAASDTASVEKLANLIVDKRVPAIFTETSVPTQGLQQVLDTVRSKQAREVRLIGGDDALYSDALGAPDSPGAVYTGMIRHNIDTILKALQ